MPGRLPSSLLTFFAEISEEEMAEEEVAEETEAEEEAMVEEEGSKPSEEAFP